MTDTFSNVHVFIMAGGGGTRFWPLSRNNFPKQFLQLSNEKSMLRLTFERIVDEIPIERIWVLTNQLYYDVISKDLPELAKENIICEPQRKDTAAAIMLAVAIASHFSSESTMAIVTADHLIEPQKVFLNTLKTACNHVANHDHLFTFGIEPDYPSTHFGYIETGERLEDLNGMQIYRVARFAEKPCQEIAEQYFAGKQHYWNSGMFVWKTSTIQASFARFLPQHHNAIMHLSPLLGKPEWSTQLNDVFAKIEATSIDYGVMEKASNAVFVRAPFHWDDVGTWNSLEKILPTKNNNAVIGNHIHIDSSGCIIHSKKQLVATVGVKDLVIVTTDDAVLVMPKNKAAQVKNLVQLLGNNNMDQYL